eukprot:jgi/Botrbrau1/5218/Bobra.0172s0082.1
MVVGRRWCRDIDGLYVRMVEALIHPVLHLAQPLRVQLFAVNGELRNQYCLLQMGTGRASNQSDAPGCVRDWSTTLVNAEGQIRIMVGTK